MNASENILILGARAPIALEMCRSFHHHGHTVFMADSLHLTLARWSNSVKKYFVLPAPAFNLEAFRKELQRIIQEYKITHCIPTCEESFYVSMIRADLPCKVWIDDIQKLDQLHNKFTFIQFAQNYFAVPQTINVANFSNWETSEKFVFKPIYSRFGHQTIIGQLAVLCKARIKQPNQWIVQELIVGKEICVYSIWEEGQLKAFSAYYPKYRYGQGAGIYFETFWDDKIFEAVQQFGKALNYTGQLSFDFIIKNGKAYVIECNPRGTSGAHLIGLKLAISFLQSKTILIDTNVQPKAIKFAVWITNFKLIFGADYKKAKDVIFQKNDIRPMFLQGLSLFELLYLKFKRNKSLSDVMTEDIEWNGFL